MDLCTVMALLLVLAGVAMLTQYANTRFDEEVKNGVFDDWFIYSLH